MSNRTPDFAAPFSFYAYPLANLFAAIDAPDAPRKRSASTEPRPTIKSLVESLDATNTPDAFIIARVANDFPESKFASSATIAKRHLAWYRNDRKKRLATATA